MPENEFEKKVSSELQQLRFKPAETVWLRVEERIRKKKKRRVFIVLFLVAGIALFGYWQWDNFFAGKNSTIVNAETPLQEDNSATDKNVPNTTNDGKSNDQTGQTTPLGKNNSDVSKPENSEQTTNKIDNNTEYTAPRKTITGNKKNLSPIVRNIKNPRNVQDPEPIQKTAVISSLNNNETKLTNDPHTLVDSTKARTADTIDARQDLDQGTILPDNKVDSVRIDTSARKNYITKDSVVKKMDTVLKTVSADSPVVNLPKQPATKKWRLGIEFIPGYSSLKEDFFSFKMSRSADAYAGPGAGSGASTAPPVNSSSGFAFQFGGFAKRQFTKQSSLIVGLRWAYYTDQIRVGSRMFPAASSPAFLQLLDALGANSAYEAGGVQMTAVNHYHFVELPVNYNLQLNKSDAHPLNLQAGLKLGQMFASNALVYDTAAGGIYYDSKKHFNKTQLGISTSLNWKINKKDKFHLAVGPAFDIHLNSLLDNPYDTKKYIRFIGLRTSMIFNSKK